MLAVTIKGALSAALTGTVQFVAVTTGIVVAVLVIRTLGSMAVGRTADARSIDDHAHYAAGELARGTGVTSAVLAWIALAPRYFWPLDELALGSVIWWLVIGVVVGLAVAIVVGHVRLHRISRSLFP